MALKSTGSFKVEGLKELDAALAELPKAVARNTLRRVLKKAGEPIAAKARALAPVDTGRLRDRIAVSARLKNKVGAAEYAAVLRSGGTKVDATAALRTARRAAKGEGSFAEIHIGPSKTPYSHLVEFGSVNNTPKPFMRPAWDGHKDEALTIIKRDLGDEIIKSAKRVANRKAKAAAKAAAGG